jgi:hypothetical protein
MKYGKVKLSELDEIQMFDLLEDIIRSCVDEAGDSYENFGISALKSLKERKLVEYGRE